MTAPNRQTMKAEMTPFVYDGPNCDEHRPQWTVSCEGGKDSGDIVRILELDPDTFPPGTVILVYEPECPDCGVVRSVSRDLESGKCIAEPKCECGFDWVKWTEENYG